MSLVALVLAAGASVPAPTPASWQAVAATSRHAIELKDDAGRIP